MTMRFPAMRASSFLSATEWIEDMESRYGPLLCCAMVFFFAVGMFLVILGSAVVTGWAGPLGYFCLCVSFALLALVSFVLAVYEMLYLLFPVDDED